MKRIISSFFSLSLAIMLLFNFSVSASASNSGDELSGQETVTVVESGDVNNDLQVNELDFDLVKKHILGLAELSSDALKVADVDADGSVDALDLAAIRKYILGIH